MTKQFVKPKEYELSAKRQFAADQALASVMIEGFKPDKDFLKDWNMTIRKEISFKEAISRSIKRAQQSKA